MTTMEAPLAPWDVAPPAFPEAGDAAEKLTFLLRYAVLAPSGHNTQPWLFSVEGETVELYADRAQALAVVDPEDRALTISCGAALFNLRVALRRFGYRDAYELLPDLHDPDLLARIRLVEGEPASSDEEALFEAIPKRRTTRAAYDEPDVPVELRRDLEEDAVREGAWLHLVPDDKRATIAELIAAGDRAQMADKRFRRELAAWVHPNRSRAKRGMRGYGFGFGDLMSHAGPLVIRTFDIGKGQAAKDRELAERSPLLAVLGTAGDTPRDWLEAGQAMERILLRACAHGLTSSFLNQPVEVDELRPRLADAIGRGDSQPQLVMRFGYGPEVAHSPRAAVEEVLAEAEE
jgi:nitroreductase